MQAPQRKLKDIQRLLSAFPPVSGDPALVLHNYLMAVEDWAADYVEDGVTLIVKGKLPGHDGRFVPTPPMVATACGIVAEAASRQRYLERLSQPALPPPDIEKTPEQRERAKAKIAEFVASVSPDHPQDEATIAIRNARWAEVNAHFDPPQDEASLTDRLHLKRPRYTTGAPESEREAS